jgi:DNA-binding transcriptional LysR family regulator
MARTIAADFLMPVLTVEGCLPSIRTGDFNELLRDLRAHELDLVVGETEPTEVARAGLVIELIYRPALVAIAAPTLEPADDWANVSLLEYRTTSVYHWEVEAFLRDKGLRPTIVGELDDAFLMVEAAVRGGFVAFVPKSVAAEAIRQKRVKAIETLSPASAGVHAVYPEKEALELARTAVQRLVENARSHFDGP